MMEYIYSLVLSNIFLLGIVIFRQITDTWIHIHAFKLKSLTGFFSVLTLLRVRICVCVSSCLSLSLLLKYIQLNFVIPANA